MTSAGQSSVIFEGRGRRGDLPDAAPREGVEAARGPGAAFFCSWSGGKDSALALQRTVSAGGIAAGLLTMMTPRGHRSRSHGLRKSVLEAQARSLGLELRTVPTTWKDYERAFQGAVRLYRQQGVVRAVFGDIDFDRNRKWAVDTCEDCGAEALEPLWKEPRTRLMEEFLSTGFRARIVAVRQGVLGTKFLGRILTRELVDEISSNGVDPAGEKGEYHTIVFDGPPFSYPLSLSAGEQVLRDGYWFQDFGVV